MIWEHPGEANTAATVEAALQRAEDAGIDTIVVASCSGRTAKMLADKGKSVVCVTHAYGFAAPGTNEMPAEAKEWLIGKGVKVLSTTHLLSGAERGISGKFGGTYPVEIMAQTLRMLGQGVKVCVEVSVMALDAGLIPYGRDIIAVGGTGEGADTAAVIRPAHAANIFATYIAEIICKPRNPR